MNVSTGVLLWRISVRVYDVGAGEEKNRDIERVVAYLRVTKRL